METLDMNNVLWEIKTFTAQSLLCVLRIYFSHKNIHNAHIQYNH